VVKLVVVLVIVLAIGFMQHRTVVQKKHEVNQYKVLIYGCKHGTGYQQEYACQTLMDKGR
jgi:hypothetical protein